MQASTKTARTLSLKRYLVHAVNDALSQQHIPNLGNSPEKCPYCNKSVVVRRGYDHRKRQRYLCKYCRKTFTVTSMNAFGSSKIPMQTWLEFIDCFIEDETLRVSAAKCNVSLKTAYYMKQRIIKALPYEESRNDL